MHSTTAEFKSVIAASRLIAMNMKHGFVHSSHVFIAMCRIDCLAGKYLQSVNISSFVTELEAAYPVTAASGENEQLPLTLELDRLIRYADLLTKSNKKANTSTLHLLLAILSYNNPASDLVHRTGVVFEDVVIDNFTPPIEKMPPPVNFPLIKPYSGFMRFVLNRKWIEKRVNEIHNQAYDQYAFELYDDCIKTCMAGQTLSKSYEPFKYFIALAHTKKRDFKNAKAAFLKLVQEYPGNSDYHVSLAFIYDEMGDHKSAAELLDALLLKKPGDETVLNNKAFNLYSQGQYAASIPYYEKAIEVKPDFAYPWNNLGFVKYKLGLVDEAFSLIEKSLLLDRGNAYAYRYLGIIHTELGNKTEAAGNFNLALKYGFTKKHGNEVLELLEKLSSTRG